MCAGVSSRCRFRRVPEGSGGFRKVPEISDVCWCRLEGSGELRCAGVGGSGRSRRVPVCAGVGSGGNFRKVLEGSGECKVLEARFGRFRMVCCIATLSGAAM